MTYLVAYDDTPLARGALRKAVEYAGPSESDVVAVTIIPRSNLPYLQDKRWVRQTSGGLTDRMQESTPDAVRNTLRLTVERIAPEATFEAVVTDRSLQTTAEVGTELRDAISEHEASDVFIGAREPSRVVTAVINPQDPTFDLHMVRRPYIPGSGLTHYS